MHVDRRRDAVLGQQLADRAVLAFAGRAVVTPDIEDQGVVAVPQPLHLVDQPANLHVDVLGISGRDLHQPALERLLVLGDVVPCGQVRVTRRQLAVFGDPAHLLGPGVDPLAVGVPAVVELAGVLVRPLLHHMVRTVQAAAGPVHEERLVGLERLVPVQPADGVVGEILTEVVALFGPPGRKDTGRVPHQVRLPLGRLPGQEPVEVLEPEAGRPIVERPGRRRLDRRGVVPLPQCRRRVAVVPQHLGGQGTALGDLARVAVPVVRELRDLTVPDPVVVPAGQQRRPRRRAHRGRVEPVVPDALLVDPTERVGPHLTAERGRKPRPSIIDQHDQDVRGVIGETPWLHPLARTPTPAWFDRQRSPRESEEMAARPVGSPDTP